MGISLAMSHGLGYTALSGLVQAMMWPMALLNVAEVIDNPWNVCTKRSSRAGEHLADVLLAREQGNRPVCLIGFGVGARVIFSCLQEMAQRENCEGIVEEAILLGAPVTADPEQWKKLQRVVSGRIVNGYSRSDWLLRFIFRTASAQLRVAGLQPIEWNHRIMHNINLKDIVSDHFDYMERIDEILALACVKSKQRVPVKHMSTLAQWTSLKQQQCPKPHVKGEFKKNSNQPAMV